MSEEELQKKSESMLYIIENALEEQKRLDNQGNMSRHVSQKHEEVKGAPEN